LRKLFEETETGSSRSNSWRMMMMMMMVMTMTMMMYKIYSIILLLSSPLFVFCDGSISNGSGNGSSGSGNIDGVGCSGVVSLNSWFLLQNQGSCKRCFVLFCVTTTKIGVNCLLFTSLFLRSVCK
jgi:hypothetical protein